MSSFCFICLSFSSYGVERRTEMNEGEIDSATAGLHFSAPRFRGFRTVDAAQVTQQENLEKTKTRLLANKI